MNTRTQAPTYRLVQLTGAAASRYEINARGQVAFSEFVEPGRVDAKFYDGNEIVDLGTLGGRIAAAVAVNDAGQVTGYSTIDGNGQYHAFLWSRMAGMVDLGTVAGAIDLYAVDINNRAQVTGTATFSEEPSARPFVWSRRTGMIDLGPLEGASAVALQINDAGRVMGQASGQEAIFSWTQAGGMEVIKSPVGFSILASDQNTAGQIVGRYNIPTGNRMFLWTPGEGLLDLGGPDGEANAINNWEMIVGRLADTQSAFAWTREGGFVDLGSLGGPSTAQDVNDLGQVVGWSQTPADGYHAFLWTSEHGMVDLNNIVSNAPAGLVLNFGQQINDNGAILAEAATGVYLLLTGPGINEPPVLTPIAISGVLDVDMPLTFSANFTDVDLGDTHTATWSWGDGSLEAGTVSESNGAGSVTGTHTYPLAGLYTVTLTLTDSGGKRTIVRRTIGIGIPAP